MQERTSFGKAGETGSDIRGTRTLNEHPTKHIAGRRDAEVRGERHGDHGRDSTCR